MVAVTRFGIMPCGLGLLLAWVFACGGSARAAPSQSQAQVTEDASAPVALQEFFDRPWAGHSSPSGSFRVNGPWVGSGGDVLDPSLAVTPRSTGGYAEALSLSVAPATPGLTPYRGSEIQSLATFGQGYYEARLQVTDVPGVCASFFWIEAPRYGPHEIDVEFLTDETWIDDPRRGAVHLTLHPSEASVRLDLPFNPSRAMHRYGFLWNAGRITFTVDGRTAHVFDDPRMAGSAPGFIMANTYTGLKNWGGGPPERTATTRYAGIRFAPGLTSVPGW